MDIAVCYQWDKIKREENYLPWNLGLKTSPSIVNVVLVSLIENVIVYSKNEVKFFWWSSNWIFSVEYI